MKESWRDGGPIPNRELASLAENPRNPRKDWKPEQVADFRASLLKFGDLGGIVLNLRSGQLVGGHKRVEVFRSSTDVEVVRAEQPRDEQGTVCHGYVLVDGTRFAYREVEWDPDTETAANLAANRWGAEWDYQLVSEALQGFTETELLALTGFPAHELDNLLAAEWKPAEPTPLEETVSAGHPHSVRLTVDQFATFREVKDRLANDTGTTLTDGQVVAMLCARFMES